MENNLSISICIPTYNRPDFLRQALQCCLEQSHAPFEIIIGDDSSNDDTEKVVHEMMKNSTINIRYFHNKPALKQTRNVNDLFEKINGQLAVLLHDDDLLLPRALEIMHAVFLKDQSIDVAYGKQYLIDNAGVLIPEDSITFNRDFFRTTPYAGSVLTSLEAAFLQQFPNDAYMIKAEVAKKVQYRVTAKDACDFDFGLRIGISNYRIHFIDEFTAMYRLSAEAVSNHPDNNCGLEAYQLLDELKVPASSQSYKDRWLKDKAPIAVMQAIRKDKKLGYKMYFSKAHRSSILTIGGVKRLLYLLLPL